MARTASIENCKKLYLLSKWGENFKADKLDLWGVTDDGVAAVITQDGLKGFPTELIPAYDADYLLDKLYERKTGLTLYHVHSTMSWEAFYSGKFFEYGTDTQHWDTQADNPADALCLLAIKMFEDPVMQERLKDV